MATGTLYLIPNTLGKTPENNTIPEFVLRIIRRLDVLVVENVQTAARYLQWVQDTVPDYEIDFLRLNKKTTDEEKRAFLQPLLEGRDAGLLSEAGCPVVADPGENFIGMAHKRGIKVCPLVGPSSILLALMASGMNGQSFTFHGYLPIDPTRRRKAIQQLEKESAQRKQTQIFMEAPHRNDAMVNDVIANSQPTTRFCTATNLTLPSESIVSKPIAAWQKAPRPSLQKKPTMFVLAAYQ